MSAAPHPRAPAPVPVLRAASVVRSFRAGRNRTAVVTPVKDVSFDVHKGEVFAIVGESGSGKTTLANLLARITEPTDGRVWLGGEDISRSAGVELAALRRRIQMVFQDPAASLNPRQSVEQIVSLPLKLGGMRDRKARRRRVEELLEMVHLPADFGRRTPGSMSGGQKQRLNIARALALDPEVLVLDEPTSALDVSVQARILALLMELRRTRGLTYVIITHDMGVVRAIADRIAVMYLGEIVEIGTADQVMKTPAHPYTRTLLSAIPAVLDADRALIPRIEVLEGEIPSLIDPPRHCSFLSRCPVALESCRNPERPVLQSLPDGRSVRCRAPLGIAAS